MAIAGEKEKAQPLQDLGMIAHHRGPGDPSQQGIHHSLVESWKEQRHFYPCSLV